MKNMAVNRITGYVVLTLMAGLLLSCKGNQKKAAATAKAFLQAYYTDLDFEQAKRLCSDASQWAIEKQASMINLNPYAKDETPDIVIRKTEIDPNNPATATCTYTCNRVERTLPLRRFNNVWLVDLGDSTVETTGFEGEFITLSQDGTNGFASSASGEIKYKKRRQGN
ncbi:MAG: hypothetical protein NC048_01550 [Bacteroides sp.]|nr:hypothetical protein [Ruminococcus flavefaciens]MCM1554166.1 hypothetical protein [Bacteroides sp.]